MSNDLNDTVWQKRVSFMTASEKNDELRLCISLRFPDRVRYLIEKENVPLTSPPHGDDMLQYAIVETYDFDMVNLLLDLGACADECEFADLQYFFYDDRDKTYDLLIRMAQVGMPIDQRAQAACEALSNGDEGVAQKLVLPHEDIYLFLDHMIPFDQKGLRHQWKIDISAYQKMFDVHFGDKMTLDKLTASVSNSSGDMTGYTLAVRAGRFDQVTSFFMQLPNEQLKVDDITTKDGMGSSVLELLASRAQLDILFQPKLWHKYPQGAETLIRAVPSRFFCDIRPDKIMQDIMQCRLSQKSRNRRNNKFKL